MKDGGVGSYTYGDYVNNITIPSSVSPVAVTLYNQQGEALDALHGKGTNFDNVTIGGIEGQLSYNQQDKKLYFARNDAGKETAITKLTQVEGKKVDFNANDSYVFFVGQNDPYYKGSIFKTINNINYIVKKYNINKYVVVSLTSKRHYHIVDDMNDVLKEEYKDHYLDFRTYLLTNGLKMQVFSLLNKTLLISHNTRYQHHYSIKISLQVISHSMTY